eukprot:6053120-Amphidinium_carterae.1
MPCQEGISANNLFPSPGYFFLSDPDVEVIMRVYFQSERSNVSCKEKVEETTGACNQLSKTSKDSKLFGAGQGLGGGESRKLLKIPFNVLQEGKPPGPRRPQSSWLLPEQP